METEQKFQEGVMRALWERLNQQRWMKTSNDDREYVLQAFQGDVEMPDQSDDEDKEYNLDDPHGSSHTTSDDLTMKPSVMTKMKIMMLPSNCPIQE
jgi:hypothetical protein